MGGERTGARLAVIDNRFRIVIAECHASGLELDRRCRPGLVEEAIRHLRELRDIVPDIGAVRIELLALEDGVEDAEIGLGIEARTDTDAAVTSDLDLDSVRMGRLRSRSALALWLRRDRDRYEPARR